MDGRNPKILHRIYFENFAPFHDPFEHFLESWAKQMPDYTVMRWNASNLDVTANLWTRRAAKEGAPVFLAEYFRWKLLAEYGGVYLDADCEIVDGPVFSGIVDELFASEEYDCFFGVEQRGNGHPTAQTVGAKKDAELVRFMRSLYEEQLGELWPWREKRGLIGPQLMALFFLNKGINAADDGFVKDIDEPVVLDRCKVYPQTYFSPKFTITGTELDYQPGKTCIYHMFANANVDFSRNRRSKDARERAATFDEYRSNLERALLFPRYYDASWLETQVAERTDAGIRADSASGVICFGPYVELPQGEYRARLRVADRPESGSATLSVTADGGRRTLGSHRFQFPLEGEIELAFETCRGPVSDLECVLIGHNVSAITIEGLEIAKLSDLKILHRIYFGFDGKPDQFATYLQTWQRELPDFKIMHWNASNLPMDANDYVRQLYKEEDHAFLTDYFRWWTLREYGGVYLDADVEVYDGARFRTLVDELENAQGYDAFIGIDKRGDGWYTAHTMASRPQSDLARFMCSVYENMGDLAVWRKKNFYFWAPQLTASYFAHKGHNREGMGTTPRLDEPVDIARVRIYPQEYFAPLSPTGDAQRPFELDALTGNTSLCHHFACSWHDTGSFYVEHSVQRGGQANVMLDDLMRAESAVTEDCIGNFSAVSGLRSVVGQVEGGTIRTDGVAGCLVFGPYVSLAKGTYRVSIRIVDCADLSDARVEVSGDHGDHYLMDAVDLQDLWDGRFARFDFTIDRPSDGLEVRVLCGKESSFAVRQVAIEAVRGEAILGEAARDGALCREATIGQRLLALFR